MSLPKVSHTVVIGGDNGVGKRALVARHCRNEFRDWYDPTLEEPTNSAVHIINGKQVHLHLYELLDLFFFEYTALWDAYIRDSEACVLVYSITSRSSFENIMTHFHRVQESKKALNSGPQGCIPVMLLGNKCDMDDKREVSREEGAAFAWEMGFEFIEVSAKTNHNVDKAMKDVLRFLRRLEPPAPVGRSIRAKPRDKILELRIFFARLLERLRQAASQPRKSLQFLRRRADTKSGDICVEEKGASSLQEYDRISDKKHRIEVTETDSFTLESQTGTQHAQPCASNANGLPT